jgi:hypothetical protein
MSTKKCRLCKRIKSVDSFYKRTSYPDGRSNECKICINEYNRAYREKRKKDEVPKKREPVSELRLNPTKPEQFCDMWDYLASAGYDVQGDIHFQFCERYGLTYNPIKVEVKNRVSYQDCLKLKDPN